LTWAAYDRLAQTRELASGFKAALRHGRRATRHAQPAALLGVGDTDGLTLSGGFSPDLPQTEGLICHPSSVLV